MFEFENLEVYKKAVILYHEVSKLVKGTKEMTRFERDQLKRASLSVVLNIAEGTSRLTNPSKRNFYMIARGSTFECVAVFEILKGEGHITEQQRLGYYHKCEEISRMLFGLVKTFEKKK